MRKLRVTFLCATQLLLSCAGESASSGPMSSDQTSEGFSSSFDRASEVEILIRSFEGSATGSRPTGPAEFQEMKVISDLKDRRIGADETEVNSDVPSISAIIGQDNRENLRNVFPDAGVALPYPASASGILYTWDKTFRNPRKKVCTASAVARKVVLTNAHCVTEIIEGQDLGLIYEPASNAELAFFELDLFAMETQTVRTTGLYSYPQRSPG